MSEESSRDRSPYRRRAGRDSGDKAHSVTKTYASGMVQGMCMYMCMYEYICVCYGSCPRCFQHVNYCYWYPLWHALTLIPTLILPAGWNKFCFTGGIVEVRAQLPGDAHTGGLWPALWLMGNLARATYVGSSENTWPWSYDKCDRSRQKGQVSPLSERVHVCVCQWMP